MIHTGKEMGDHKHAISGYNANFMHFTGPKGSNTHRKNKSTIKQRRVKMNTHINKYKTES